MTPTLRSDRKRIVRKLLIFPALALMYAVLYLLDATCIIKHFTGIECPGCGLTRAWLSVMRFDLVTAFQYNPMFWSVPIIFLYYWRDLRVFKSKFLNYAVIIVISVGFLANWIFGLLT